MRQGCTRSRCWSRTGRVASSARPTIRWHFSPSRGHGPTRPGCGVARLLEVAAATGDVELEILSRADGPEVGVRDGARERLDRARRIDPAGGCRAAALAAPLRGCRSQPADWARLPQRPWARALPPLRAQLARRLCALEQGRWDEAVDWADQVIRTPRASISPRILALTTVGLVRARRGDPDPWSPLDEAYDLAIRERRAAAYRSPVGCARRSRVARGSRLRDR